MRERVCAGSLIQRGDQMKQTPESEEREISNRMKERSEATGSGCWMFTERNLQNEICMWARVRLGVHASSLMHSCTTTCIDSLSFPPTVFRPCWRHKGSCAPMCPTSPSIWASQGNSFTPVRCRENLLLLLIQAEIRPRTKPKEITLLF